MKLPLAILALSALVGFADDDGVKTGKKVYKAGDTELTLRHDLSFELKIGGATIIERDSFQVGGTNALTSIIDIKETPNEVGRKVVVRTDSKKATLERIFWLKDKECGIGWYIRYKQDGPQENTAYAIEAVIPGEIFLGKPYRVDYFSKGMIEKQTAVNIEGSSQGGGEPVILQFGEEKRYTEFKLIAFHRPYGQVVKSAGSGRMQVKYVGRNDIWWEGTVYLSGYVREAGFIHQIS